MKILLNNQWLDEQSAKLSMLSDAAMFGVGVFETFRTFKGRKLFLLSDHIDRLLLGATIIGIKVNFSHSAIASMVERVCHESEYELQRIKLTAWREGIAIYSSELQIDLEKYKGITAKSVVQSRSLPEIKSTSYLDCHLSYKKAIDSGFSEAILIDGQGLVTEGSRSNIFWTDGNHLFTRESGVLPGITRKALIQLKQSRVLFESISLSELCQKKEVFLCNSILGIVPIIGIDQFQIGSGYPGIQTEQLSQLYNEICQK